MKKQWIPIWTFCLLNLNKNALFTLSALSALIFLIEQSSAGVTGK